jgi:hypothetical protein
MDKAAEKRARRLARKRGETEEEDGAADPDGSLPVDSTEQSQEQAQ